MEFNILIFGDSITYGAFDYQNGGWVNRLRLLLEKEYNYYFNIYNLGIPGNTTLDIINRFECEFKSRYNKMGNNIIIFQVGINDSYIINNKNNVNIDSFKNNIVTLINKSKKYTSNIMFLGLSSVNDDKTCPCSWEFDIKYLNNEIVKFDNELEDICEHNNVSYIRIFDLFDKCILEDGLHPNDIGHERIMNEVLVWLKNII